MATTQTIVRSETLTQYARGIYPDLKPVIDLADKIAPRVLTGTATGDYNVFNDRQAFVAYDAARAIGGKARRIGFLTTNEKFDCTPYALEIPIDDAEFDRCGASGESLLREAKTRTLLLNAANSHLRQVCDVALAKATAATTGAGKWSTATVDPIAEIDAEIAAMWSATGLCPNRLVLDLGAWIALRNNAKVIERFNGIAASPTAEQVKALFAVPIDLVIATAAITDNFGQVAATKRSPLGAKKALLFYASDSATQYDPSFCKTFTTDLQLFEGIGTYREPRAEVVAADWTADVRATSSALGHLFTVA